MTAKADSKRRIVLPGARPGDIFDVREEGDGIFVLARLQRPQPRGQLSREECLRAMEAAPLHPRMSWDELAEITREP